MRFIALRSLRNWGTILAVVFTGLLLTPRASEATCGDYLHVGNRSAAVVRTLPNLPKSIDVGSHNVADPSQPQPCHGPGCSRSSSPAPAAPVAVVVFSIEQWALTSVDTIPNIVGSDQLLAEPFDVDADGSRLSILRPPR
jgi:hypothetical protein